MDVNNIKCFDIITGSSLGGCSDAGMCKDMLNVLQAISDHPIGVYPPMDQYWREFAIDLMEFIKGEYSTFDVNYISDLLSDHITPLLPHFTSIEWHDGELSVTPHIEDVRESVTCVRELPYDEENVRDTNKENEEFIGVINDHGNLTLYMWDIGKDGFSHWEVVWAVV